MYATTEGVVRAPSEFSMTFGVPFSMTATHELVVPRSMPMIFAILSSLVSQITFATRDIGLSRSVFNAFGFRDHRERGANHAVVQEVAFLQHLHDGIGLRVGVDRADRLVEMRIEFLSEGIDLPHVEFLEHGFQLPQRELHPRADVFGRRG